MDITQLVTTVSGIVSIIGGGVGIVRTLKGKAPLTQVSILIGFIRDKILPLFTRKRQAASPATAPAATSAATPAPPDIPLPQIPGIPQSYVGALGQQLAQSAQALGTTQSGWRHGLKLALPMLGVLVGIEASILNESLRNASVWALGLVAVVVLSIFGGVVPVKTTGKIRTSLQSGLILALMAPLELAVIVALLAIFGGSSQQAPQAAVIVFLIVALVFGLPVLLISFLSGVIGRLAIKRALAPVAVS